MSIKKETLVQVFPVNFVKFLRTHFYRTTLGDWFWFFKIQVYLAKHDSKGKNVKSHNNLCIRVFYIITIIIMIIIVIIIIIIIIIIIMSR